MQQNVLYCQSEQQEVVAAAPLKHKLQQLLLNPASKMVSTVCVCYQVSTMLHLYYYICLCGHLNLLLRRYIS